MYEFNIPLMCRVDHCNDQTAVELSIASSCCALRWSFIVLQVVLSRSHISQCFRGRSAFYLKCVAPNSPLVLKFISLKATINKLYWKRLLICVWLFSSVCQRLLSLLNTSFRDSSKIVSTV